MYAIGVERDRVEACFDEQAKDSGTKHERWASIMAPIYIGAAISQSGRQPFFDLASYRG